MILILVSGCAIEKTANTESYGEKAYEGVDSAGKYQSPILLEEEKLTQGKKIQQHKKIAIIEFSGLISKAKAAEFDIKLKQLFLTGGVNEFIVYIDSGGGDSDAGLVIYNSIKSIPILVTTVNVGSVGSAAVWMFCAGKRRFAMPNTSFIIHGSSTQNATIDSDTQLEYFIETRKKFYELQRNIIESCSSMSSSLIDDYIKSSDNRYLTIYKAKEIGLIQKIGQPNLKKSEDISYEFYLFKD